MQRHVRDWTLPVPFAKVGQPVFRGNRAAKPFRPRPEVRAPMLVLTRKTNQSIMIGDDIEITVLSVSGDKVRIGIEAPRSISVFRQEVYETMDEDSTGEEQDKDEDED